MPTFPLISALPPSTRTLGWTWQKVTRPGHASDGFWIGTDKDGNRWLTKLRGSFYAHREIVFGRLAQSMGWSCQSSIYAVLDATSARLLGRKEGEVHAVHWWLAEHEHGSCNSNCGINHLSNLTFDAVEGFENAGFTNMRDSVKCLFAAYIFGANEPSGALLTTHHEYVIIDSEQMFSSRPSEFSSSDLLINPDGSHNQHMAAIALETCCEISALSQATVGAALAVPIGVNIECKWSVRKIINAGIQLASDYVKKQTQLA